MAGSESDTLPRGSFAPADPDELALRELRHARELYETFIEKAGRTPEFSDAVTRTRDRLEDLDRTIAFLEQGIAERAGR